MYTLSQIACGLGRCSGVLTRACRPIRATSSRTKWTALCRADPQKGRHMPLHLKCFCSSSNNLDVAKSRTPVIAKIIPDQSTANEDSSIREADNIDSLLALHKNSTSVQKIGLMLNRICDFHRMSGASTESLISNKLYRSLLDDLDRQVLTMPPQTLLSCVRSLMTLNQDDTDVLKSLLTQLLWLMRKMTTEQLFHVHENFYNTSQTHLRKQIRDAALESLMLRWMEIEPKHLVTLLYRLEGSQSQHVSNLEKRALDLCSIMTAKELYRVLFYLAKQRHRNTPLIRAAVYHLNKLDWSLSFQHLANLGYACVSLSIFHNELLVKWAGRVAEELANPRHSVDRSSVVSLTQTVGMLRLRQTNILDTLSAMLLSDVGNMGPQELSALLMTCAVTDYVPSSLEEILGKISLDLSSDTPKVFLDTLWSLAVLQRLPQYLHHIDILFTEEFLGKLKDGSNSDTTFLKLMNIHTAATFDVPGYKDANLPRDFIDANKIMAPVTSKRPVLDKIAAALRLVAPGEKYMRRDVLHASGHVLDFELKINSKGDFVAFAESDETPSNYQAVAIKLLNFSDLTLGEVHPVGRLRMLYRQLSEAGYRVVNIMYHEYPETATTVKQIEYLKSKVKKSQL